MRTTHRHLLMALAAILTINVATAAKVTKLPQHKSYKTGLEAISLVNARASLYFLADDALRGRFTGSPEALISARYLISELEQMGYSPVLQPFTGRKGERMQNILIDIPGSDPNERVIFGAHYDHEGVKDGEIYNGADDNASGTVAVLEIARALRHAIEAGATPRRSITIALWDGEERGLQGSRHYAAQITDTAAVKYYVNFDIVGRNSDEANPRRFDYFFTEANPELKDIVSEAIVAEKLELELTPRPWDKPTGGSDNAPFARRMIPISWFHTNGHPDFHKPTDTADKINYPKLIEITKAGYYLIWKLAF